MLKFERERAAGDALEEMRKALDTVGRHVVDDDIWNNGPIPRDTIVLAQFEDGRYGDALVRAEHGLKVRVDPGWFSPSNLVVRRWRPWTPPERRLGDPEEGTQR